MEKKKIKQPTGITVTRIYEPDMEAMKKGLRLILEAPTVKQVEETKKKVDKIMKEKFGG